MKLTNLFSETLTTGAIAIGPVNTLNSEKPKKKKKAKIFTESDHNLAVQNARSKLMELKKTGLAIDEIILNLSKNYDTTVIKDALKELL